MQNENQIVSLQDNPTLKIANAMNEQKKVLQSENNKLKDKINELEKSRLNGDVYFGGHRIDDEMSS